MLQAFFISIAAEIVGGVAVALIIKAVEHIIKREENRPG